MNSMEHSNLTSAVDEDEINLKELFGTLRVYRKSIFFITVLFTLFAAIYAYISPNIYSVTTMIKLMPEKRGGMPTDFMAMALGGAGSNIDDEIVVFKTRDMAEKALESLSLGTRYYATKHFRTRELYKNSPFVIIPESVSEKLTGLKFQLIPQGGDMFRLVMKPTFKTVFKNMLRSYILPVNEADRPVEYEEIHRFGERIETPWFTFTIQKIYQPEGMNYSFSLTPNEQMHGFIQNGLSASAVSKQGHIISLSFTDPVALRAKEILDALAHSYMQESLDIKSEGAQKKLNFIDIQLDAINTTLQGSEKKLERFKATNIVVNLGDKAQLTAEKLSELESQLYELNMNIDVLENILNYLHSTQEIKGIDVGAIQLASPAINALVRQILDANNLYSSLSVDYTLLHPDVIKVSKQLEALKQSLKETIGSNLLSIKKRKYRLERIISQHKRTLQSFPEQERKLTQLTRNFMVNERIYSFLLEKRAETAIIESSTVSEARIVETAAVPKEPVKPKRMLLLIVGSILGIIVGVALAFLRAFLDSTIKTVEDIEHHTTIPLYGAIPILKSKKNSQPYYEALRVTSTNLEFLQNSSRSKVITITSSVPGEGKSFTTSELGKILAKNGKKVIILDLDLRRSTLHEKLDLPNDVGMSTLITGKSTLREVISSTSEAKLQVITAGPFPPNPAGLIMSDTLKLIVEKFSNTYDYVLLDSPPIGLVSDAMTLMHMSDITLIMMKAEYSKKEFLKNINRFTREHGINAGIILNGIELGKKFGYGYGYGYGYGSQYGSDYYSGNSG